MKKIISNFLLEIKLENSQRIENSSTRIDTNGNLLLNTN